MTDNHNARRPGQSGEDGPNEPEDAYDEILQALEDEDLPEYYANSFAVNLGTGDVTLVMKRNNKRIGLIQMSYTAAKSLAAAISELVERMEKATGHEIMTSKYIAARMLEDITNNDENDAR
jgi:hypothetical protein